MQPSPRPAPKHRGNESELSFASDGLRLRGTLHLPTNPHPHFIVGSHGLYSSGDSPKQQELADRCCRMGLAYFRFDHRGCGRSEGHFEAVTTLNGRRQDLIDAVAFIRSHFDMGAGLGLFGSSLGGATCLAAAASLDPQRMVTLAAPVDSRSILAAAENHAAPVESRFFEEAFQFDLRGKTDAVRGILVVHGTHDEVIPSSHADVIFQRAREPKKRLLIRQGDHRLSRREHQKRFMDAAQEWFKPLTNLAPADT